ncbi:MAG: polysaccharide deacetylase family protein [Anaeromyxobacter sp.]|nr:polysaccharide deacetylase family protein [Anaeromyxobacter sp.]
MTAPAWTALRRRARDAVGRLLLGAGLTRPSRAAADHLTVATLHRVLPEVVLPEYPLGQLAVGVDELIWLVAFLREHYTCDTLSAAHRRFQAGERPSRPLLALTFDDGQLDNFVQARPVLERAGVPGTFFVPVEAVDGDQPLWHDRLAYAARRLLAADRPAALRLLAGVGVAGAGSPGELAALAVARSKSLAEVERRALVDRLEQACGGGARPPWDGPMSWAQLRLLAAAGHEIGSHSLSHPLLPGVDDVQLAREVAGSKARVEAELGAPCLAFCYPNGDQDERVVAAVRRAGYQVAVVTAWGPNPRGADPLRLTRCDLQGSTSRDEAGHLSAARLALRLSPWFGRLRR